MKIAVTGASGLVGRVVVSLLQQQGHEVCPATRKSPTGSAVQWDPERGLVEPSRWEGLDGVVHLAGENIAAGRWTAAQKEKIRRSRVDGTRNLATGLASLARPPRVCVLASATGYYGSRGSELLTEGSASGTGFLAEVCRQWEAAAQPLLAAQIRVVQARFGIILASGGGALQKMLLPFQLGVGGRVGSGSQYWSWVSIDDVAAAIVFALQNESVRGPINVVAPESLTNADFTRVLGRVLRRPTIFPMPAFAARLALGEMADELLLASTRVAPDALQRAGFQFRHPQLEVALRAVLKR